MRLIRETDFGASDLRRIHRRRRRGGLLRPVGRLAKRAVKAGWKLSTHDFSLAHLAAEGFIEPAATRYMVDFGSYAELSAGGQLFGGRSGRALNTLEAWGDRSHRPDPWWMLAVLRGAAKADLEAREAVSGTQCERYSVRADLARASAASPRGLYAPAAERFEDLRELPLTVWHDGDRIHRVRYADGACSTVTLELWDFGVATDGLDWDRLPTFKSPKHPAAVGSPDPLDERNT